MTARQQRRPQRNSTRRSCRARRSSRRSPHKPRGASRAARAPASWTDHQRTLPAARAHTARRATGGSPPCCCRHVHGAGERNSSKKGGRNRVSDADVSECWYQRALLTSKVTQSSALSCSEGAFRATAASGHAALGELPPSSPLTGGAPLCCPCLSCRSASGRRWGDSSARSCPEQAGGEAW